MNRTEMQAKLEAMKERKPYDNDDRPGRTWNFAFPPGAKSCVYVWNGKNWSITNVVY